MDKTYKDITINTALEGDNDVLGAVAVVAGAVAAGEAVGGALSEVRR